MIRKLLALFFIGITIFWLVASYLPVDAMPWRIMANERLTPLFLVALTVSALLFIVIQIILVSSIFKFPQRVSREEQDSSSESQQINGGEIRIHRRWEFIWTAIPLAASVLLFVVSYYVLIG
jgi:heme/copper-type cytochrome/quinol oxidase subunit 2